MDFFLWNLLKSNVFWTWIFVIDIVFQFITVRQRSCGKVLFSRVCHSLHRRIWCHLLSGPMFFLEGYDVTSCLVPCSFQRGMMPLPVLSHVPFRGVWCHFLFGPMFFPEGVWCHILSGPMFLPGGLPLPPYGGRAGGTHPTGMLSCSLIFLIFFSTFS